MKGYRIRKKLWKWYWILWFASFFKLPHYQGS